MDVSIIFKYYTYGTESISNLSVGWNVDKNNLYLVKRVKK
jgi:hypothetical protein